MVDRKTLLLLAFAVIAFACKSPTEQAAAPRVTIDAGVLEGSYSATGSETAVFKGIPYARPPVGDLRWKPPQSAESWKGVRAATTFGPSCPQPDFLSAYFKTIDASFGIDEPGRWELGETNEDCLYLNVYTANLSGKEKLPVMVWIHGGSNYMGSASDLYDGEHLTGKGAVVVTINYSLGVLGFLAHPALTAESPHHSSGNYALLDQLEALRWIQKNISVFGGDPERVTIFGESAGGTDVGLLMASILSKGLFHRAIAQSCDAGLNTFQTLEAAEAIGNRLAGDLAVAEEEEVMAALRRLSADEIISSVYKGRGANPYGPIVDGWVLHEPPAMAMANGRQQKVPLLIGSNADEGTLLAPVYLRVKDVDQYKGWAQNSFGPFAERIRVLYPVTRPDDIPHTLSQWMTDFIFGAPARNLARSMEKANGKAYLYQFTRVPPGPGGARMGAFHGSEVAFVFNAHPEKWPKQSYDDALTETMSSYWVQFAATGDPNRDGLPHWPAYDSSTDQHLELGEEIRVGSGLFKEAADLFDEILEARMKPGT